MPLNCFKILILERLNLFISIHHTILVMTSYMQMISQKAHVISLPDRFRKTLVEID